MGDPFGPQKCPGGPKPKDAPKGGPGGPGGGDFPGNGGALKAVQKGAGVGKKGGSSPKNLGKGVGGGKRAGETGVWGQAGTPAVGPFLGRRGAPQMGGGVRAEAATSFGKGKGKGGKTPPAPQRFWGPGIFTRGKNPSSPALLGPQNFGWGKRPRGKKDKSGGVFGFWEGGKRKIWGKTEGGGKIFPAF